MEVLGVGGAVGNSFDQHFLHFLGRLLIYLTHIHTAQVRNSTGHWSVSCYQAELAYYMLSLQVGYNIFHVFLFFICEMILGSLQPGYKSQWQDCMICSYVGGPLLIRLEDTYYRLTFTI